MARALSLLEVSGVRKAFPGVTALAGVDLSVETGEVHALLGENGAGKSTLMKVIAGAVTPDAGRLLLRDEELELGSPEAARACGIAAVYQELSLVPSLSIGENVLLGRWPRTRLGLIDWPALFRESKRYLEMIDFEIDVHREVSGLGMAERQLVEIAKSLASGDVSVLLLDEPTSALSERESTRLFDIIDEVKQRGVAIVYVSHRLKEILRIADRVTVLRDGKLIGTVLSAEVDEASLASMMVGREVKEPSALPRSNDESTRSDVVLRATAFGRRPRLKHADFELREGEILGVFGLVGAGRTRLARSLFGLEPATHGSLELFGEVRRIRSPAEAIEHGLGYVGEDRSIGLVPRMSVAENVTLATLSSGRSPLVDFAGGRRIAERYAEELGMRVTSVDALVDTLSGGNQQKVLLARWLCSRARILVLDDPTRGIDVGAKEEVFRLVRKLANEGVAVLYLTSEIKEARSLPKRLLVMANGRVVTEMNPQASEEAIMEAAGGGAHG